jgi:hypothetical protein
MGIVTEGNSQADLDLPAGYTDFFDHEPDKALATFEVEAVEAVGDAGGKIL